MKQPEYAEGPQVREEFERTMTALFRAPKPTERKPVKKRASPKKTSERKLKKSASD